MTDRQNGAEPVPAAAYIRLSAADGCGAKESGSVANQRAFLHQWAEKNGFAIVKDFVDDGHTGTDFDRPGFKALMKWLEAGTVKTFLTTDLSRLGRNYLEVGMLQEQTFPTLGIRYIAVTDGYDSAEKSTLGGIDPVIFKNLLNDAYAKDISNKVIRAKRTLQREGKFIGNLAPYGYRIDPKDRHRILPEEETAAVVARIYRDFLAGETACRIAACLTAEAVPTPAAHKQLKGRTFSGVWSAQTVRRILSLPTYYGAITQHRTEMVSYKVHISRKLRPAEWIVVPGTHEALVSEEDFAQAQRMLAQRACPAGKADRHLLSGITYCADCGGRMYPHPVGGICYMTCYTYSRNPGLHRCTAHAVREDALENAVLSRLRALAARAVDVPALARACSRNQPDRGRAESRRAKLQRQLEKTKAARVSAYKDKAAGLLSEEEYRDIAEGLRSEEAALNRQLGALPAAESAAPGEREMQEKIRGMLRFRDIGKAQLQQLVKRIEVGADRTIAIEYAFRDPAPKKIDPKSACGADGGRIL